MNALLKLVGLRTVKNAAAKSHKPDLHVQLTVETLEDRALCSASPLGGASPTTHVAVLQTVTSAPTVPYPNAGVKGIALIVQDADMKFDVLPNIAYSVCPPVQCQCGAYHPISQ